MIIRVLINNNEYAVDVYENNPDGEVQINDTFHVNENEVDVERDTVFGTLDNQITIKIPYETIKEIVKDYMVEDAVSILRSRGAGNTYDRSHAFDTAHDVLSDLKYDIADAADKIMTNKYTTKDGLTIIDDVLKDCPHKCGDCIGTEYYGQECLHGCGDCGYFDGGNCIHSGSNHCGCLGGECAHDCYEWDNGE